MENRSWLSAPDEIDDLDLVAIAHERCGERVSLDDDHVVLDGNTPGIDVQSFEQLLHGHWLLEIVRVPVERNPHGPGLAEFYCTESGGWWGGNLGRSERSLAAKDERSERPERPERFIRRRPSVPASGHRRRRASHPPAFLPQCGHGPECRLRPEAHRTSHAGTRSWDPS